MGAAAALAMAAPGLAHADASGVIDLGYQNDDYDNGNSFDAFHLGGAFQMDMMSGWTLQFDGASLYQDWDGSSGSDQHSHAAVHADTTGGTWDFGGWAGLLNYYDNSGLTIGGETRTSFGDFSLQGSVGYATFDQYYDYSSWDGHVDGAYFFSPNMAVTAGLTYNAINYDGGNDDTQTEWSLGGAYQFANGVEIYGGYLNSNNDFSGSGGSNDVDVVNVGFRFHFNGGSLQDYTNHGASWNGAAVLSDAYSRW